MAEPTSGEILVALRGVAAMSQEQFAKQIGCIGQTVSRFECGRFIPRSFKVLKGLARCARKLGREDLAQLFDAQQRHRTLQIHKPRFFGNRKARPELSADTPALPDIPWIGTI